MRTQAELKQKLTDLEDDKLTLEQQLETGFKMGKGTQVKSISIAKNKKMLEEKAQKEREEMKRQLLLGMEVSGGQRDDLRIMMAQ
jgi:hypothetical protein